MFLTDLQKNILKQKGFDIENDIEKFLNPNWDRDIFDSSKIKDIDKSVERIKKAIDENEKIIIYADYDSDGIPGAVVLHDFFQKINYKNFSIYIPHRHNEGYGLNINAIKKFINEKVNLIITVDIGITNIEEIKFAQDNNIDVIVTDHHLPILTSLGPFPAAFAKASAAHSKERGGMQIIPNAFAVINTKQGDDEYQEKFLCGASTAWKLIHHFLNKYRKEFDIQQGWEKWLLDMIGIATIADLVPLKNENRLFAKFGLEVLKKTKRPGLLKILKNAKIDQRKINEDDIAFGIAPRINAASRMAEPIHAFYALLQNDESINFANELEKYNDARKLDTKDAHTSIDYEKFKDEKIIFIGDEKWTPGIIGLVASKICETTNKTAFVWGVGEDKNILKGSVRAGNDGYNVVSIMTEAKDILENFGGHEAAGGFSIHKDNLEKFREFLKKYSDLGSLQLLSNNKVPTSPQPSPKEREKPKYITTNYIYKYIKDGIKEQKKKQTKYKEILWQEIRNKKLGFKFRRQHGIEMFVPDFVCLEKMLIIEVDGEIHENQIEHDKERENYLESLGYKVLRFKNQEIENNLEESIKQIKFILNSSPSLGGVGEVGLGLGQKKEKSFIPLNLYDINKNLFNEIKIFAPFGVENEKIIFKIKLNKNHILKTKRFGKSFEHLEINFIDNESEKIVRAIEFFVNEEREEELKNQKEFLINVEWDNYRSDIVMKFVK